MEVDPILAVLREVLTEATIGHPGHCPICDSTCSLVTQAEAVERLLLLVLLALTRADCQSS
jgi:hypothetical protein